MRIGFTHIQKPNGLNHTLGPGKQSVSDAALPSFNLLEALGQWEHGESQNKSRVRWHRESLPIAIFMENIPTEVPFSEQEFQKLLFTALKQWELAGQGLIRFQTGFSSQEQAGIQLNWTQTATEGRTYEVGHTNRKVQGPWIHQAKITLLSQPVIDRHLSPERQKQRLYSTLLHELGHALGLEHTEAERDVMHHRGWRNLCLSDNDVRQVQALYSPQAGFFL